MTIAIFLDSMHYEISLATSPREDAMGLTYELDVTAEAFNWGLLAAKVSTILRRHSGIQLSPDEKNTLRAGLLAIQQLLDGAKTLHSGHSVSGVTAESIKSLGLALTPLQQLQRLCGKGATSDEGIISLLSSMMTALHYALESSALPDKTPEIHMTEKFFSFVADRTLSSLNRSHWTITQATA